MIFFDDKKGNIRAFDSGQESLIDEDWQELSSEEVQNRTTYKKTIEEKIIHIRNAIGNHIDSQAQQTGPFGFDNIISAVSYADDTEDTVNQPYGAALKVWRRECWNKAREILTAWQGGGAEPTLEEVISQLPAFVEPQ